MTFKTYLLRDGDSVFYVAIFSILVSELFVVMAPRDADIFSWPHIVGLTILVGLVFAVRIIHVLILQQLDIRLSSSWVHVPARFIVHMVFIWLLTVSVNLVWMSIQYIYLLNGLENRAIYDAILSALNAQENAGYAYGAGLILSFALRQIALSIKK